MEVVRYEAQGWGIGEVAVEGPRLLYHELPRPRPAGSRPNHPQGIGRIPVVRLAGNSSRVGVGLATKLAQRLAAYFHGTRASFDDVELDLAGYTPFQRAMTEVLRTVPRGHTITYGELAALAGRPNAPRAAGNFCRISRFGVVVPCHRVVAAGGIGGYGSFGLDYKRRLLALDGVDLAF